MPCYKCNHELKEHTDEHGLAGEGNPCAKCDCKSYGPTEFECRVCGESFDEREARQGHDLCQKCADRDYGGNVMFPE